MGRRRVYANAAERARAWRARQRVTGPPDHGPLGTDAAAVAEWAASKLRIPAGHGRAGRPFVLEPWQLAIIDDCLTHRETLLCIARKNAKSALIAVLALAHLVGPLRRPGWRCGVLSASRIKAGELLGQCVEIAEASSMDVASGRQSKANADLQLKRTPWPGKLISVETGGRLRLAHRRAMNTGGNEAQRIEAPVEALPI